MKIAIMQPYFLPYIGYFQLMNSVDKFVILDDVNYKKKSWINRNCMLVDGKDKMFTIPLNGMSQNKRINELTLSEEVDWKKDLLRMIKHSYSKAPNFREVYSLLEDVIMFDVWNLAEFIRNSLKKLNDYLKINTSIIDSSTVYNNQELKGQDRIVDICKKESADDYINAIGGREIYSKEDFLNQGLNISFLRTVDIEYQQFNNEFIPSLSIIDILMFNDNEKVAKFLDKYELV